MVSFVEADGLSLSPRLSTISWWVTLPSWKSGLSLNKQGSVREQVNIWKVIQKLCCMIWQWQQHLSSRHSDSHVAGLDAELFGSHWCSLTSHRISCDTYAAVTFSPRVWQLIENRLAHNDFDHLMMSNAKYVCMFRRCTHKANPQHP